MKAPDSQQANIDWKNDVVYKRENANDTAVDDVDDDKTKGNTCFHCNVVATSRSFQEGSGDRRRDGSSTEVKRTRCR